MMTQILIVFIIDKLLSIDGIGTLIKKIITKKGIVLYKLCNINLKKFQLTNQLRRWEEQLQSGGSRIDKLSYISKFTYDKFTAAVESGFMVYDVNIKRCGLYKLKKK